MKIEHEDDLAALAHEGNGTVYVSNLVDHLRLLARSEESIGVTNAKACRAAARLIEQSVLTMQPFATVTLR